MNICWKGLFFVFLLFFGMSFQSKHDYETPISSNPETKKLVLGALNQIYNFQFGEAEKEAYKIKQALPGHPIYHILMAMLNNWQWEPEINNEQLYKNIIYHLNRTLTISDSIIKKSKTRDAEIMFIHFTAHGFLARINSIRGNYVSAVDHAMSAYNAVKKGFDLKDHFYDYYFSTGMYNYYREKYPEMHPVIKPFAVMLSKGNPELGIKQLQFAYAHSLFSKIESANYLINIFYKYEGKPEKAFDITEEINKSYPENLFFNYKFAEGVLATARPMYLLIKPISLLTESNSKFYCAAGYYISSARLYAQGNFDEALKNIEKSRNLIETLPHLQENLLAYIYLLNGKIERRLGDNKKAVNYLKKAQQRADYPSTKKEASFLLKKLNATGY